MTFADDQSWDRQVCSMPSGTPFQRPGWLKARGYTDGTHVVRMADPGRRWVAGILVTSGPAGDTMWVPRGPAGHCVRDVLDAVDAIVAEYPDQPLTVSPYLLQGDGAAETERALRKLGFGDGPAEFEGATVIIDVAVDDVVLMKRMSKTVAWTVRRQLEDPAITVAEDLSDAAIASFEQMYRRFASTRPVSPLKPGFLGRLREYGLGNDLGTLLFCRKAGELCSAALVLTCGELAWLSRAPHWPGRPPLGVVLQWHAMRWARAHGCRRYDLGGLILDGPRAADTAGLTLFKRRLGGAIVRTVPSLRRTPQ